jgi:murein L,D-transpeptidase YcbB/YkuD
MKNEEPQDIRIKKKVPCIIYYLTADVGETGALEFYRDAYRIEQ